MASSTGRTLLLVSTLLPSGIPRSWSAGPAPFAGQSPAQKTTHTMAQAATHEAAHSAAHEAAQWVEPGDDNPAHFTGTPHPGGAPILSGAKLSGPYFTRPFQLVIYKMAALVAPVLYQQPCFCRCDRALRHKSLHSCFEGLHGAACGTCMREAMYAYQQTRAGKTPAEIRAGLERGEWQMLHLEDAAL